MSPQCSIRLLRKPNEVLTFESFLLLLFNFPFLNYFFIANLDKLINLYIFICMFMCVCLFIYIHRYRLMFYKHMCIGVYLLKVCIHLFHYFVSQAFISTQISLPMLPSLDYNQREKNVLWLHMCASPYPFCYSLVWLNCMLPGENILDVFNPAQLYNGHKTKVRAWGTHFLFSLDHLWIFCAFCCKESLFCNELKK